MNRIEDYLRVDESLLSKSERRLHKYICEHLKEVEVMSIYALADETLTSRATIDRYLKKINISGFKQLKSIINNSENDMTSNLEIDLFISYLKKNPKMSIGVVGSGVSSIACDYLARRMQVLGYFVHSYTYDTVAQLKHNLDVMIVISSAGSLNYSVNKDLIKDYSGMSFAITAPESKLAEVVGHVISNNKGLNQSKYERENMLTTIEIIELIFYRLSELG